MRQDSNDNFNQFDISCFVLPASCFVGTKMNESVKKRKKTKSTDPLVEKAKVVKTHNKAMLKAALDTAKGVKAKYLFLYIDAVDDELLPDTLPRGLYLILVSKKKKLKLREKNPDERGHYPSQAKAGADGND